MKINRIPQRVRNILKNWRRGEVIRSGPLRNFKPEDVNLSPYEVWPVGEGSAPPVPPGIEALHTGRYDVETSPFPFDEAARLIGATIDVVLYCPHCNTQHIDEPAPGWDNPPHKTHLCRKDGCGHLWRPSDHCTNGVLRTNSSKDGDTRPRGWTRQQVTELLNRSVTAPLILTGDDAARVSEAIDWKAARYRKE